MAGFISPATLEQIRAANDIVDVISAVVPLKRAGVSFTALCPFHREKTPSFHVNPRKQTFHCFGCHKGGDVFTFVREHEGLDFPEAVKRLAERARIPLEFENDPALKEQQFLKDRLLHVNEQITQRWHNCLLNEASAERARAYLGKRGVSEEAIKLFRLGYSPEAWEDTINWGRSKAFEATALEAAGLAVRKEGSDHFYGRFRDRLMFPICDDQSRVIGFSGRVLPPSDDPRKYVNSPETLLFHKSRVMFGLHKSKTAINDKRSAIICEGQLDLISCFTAGVQNIVAPQGTAFTKEHARILKRWCDEVVLCFDSDEAGQKATVRALDDLLDSSLAIRVANVPAPHDPDSFIKNFGAAAFQELITKAEGFFDYYLNRLCKINDTNSDKGRQAILQAMTEALQKTKDNVLIETYLQKVAARLGISSLARRLRAEPQRAAAVSEAQFGSLTDEARPNAQELWLLKILLQNDEYLSWSRQNLSLPWIQHAGVREILDKRLGLDAAGEPIQPAAMLGFLSSDAVKSLVTSALAEERFIPKLEEQVVLITTRLRNQSIDREMAALQIKLNSVDIDSPLARQIGDQISQLRTTKAQILPPLVVAPG